MTSATADFIAPNFAGGYAWNRPALTGTAATFQAWDTFTSPVGPNASQNVVGTGTGNPVVMSTGVANIFKGFGGDATASWTTISTGTPNAFDTAAPGNGAFITSGGNIYSTSAAVMPRIVIPNNIDASPGNNPFGTTTLLLQLRTQGGEPTLGTLRLTDPTSGTEVLPQSIAVLGTVALTPGPMGGGNIVDRLFTFQVAGNADLYTFDFSTGGSSVSLDRIAVDTFWNPVPEPGLIGLAAFATLAAGSLSRRRLCRVV